ncbi:hypothetical protein FSP39_021891 [Pinctada imbricata]|uniref:Metalloendopeptidase n=1 Tax=Pinctada imbricata TaxID=66713 RepID=A0AA89C0T2_PINIB|nr:hypothetical protein FSP39_021891 [Pinctada imbricata]
MTPEDLAEIQSMRRVRRKAVHKNYKLWPDGVVHYEFDKNVGESNRSMILRAIHHWEEHTCLKFVPSNGQGDRISFIISDRCTSNIGKAGGKQSIDLSLECIKELGSIAHEIGHAAGFYHEHSRPDRDDHIKVIKENIQTGRTGEFNKYGESTVRDIEPYDVSSVMHYGLTYFSKDDESHTLDPIDPKLQEWLGQRVGLSFMDIKTANELYNYKCPKSLACKNEGYIGPKCACVCPDGITGDLCTEVIQTKKACGGVLTSPSGTITSPNYPGSYDVNTECNWMIQGSAGSVITLTFHYFEVENDDKGMCHWDFLEIRKYGPHLPGQR